LGFCVKPEQTLAWLGLNSPLIRSPCSSFGVDNQLIHETFVLKIVTLKPGKVLNLALQNVRGYTNSGIALNRFFRHEEGEQLYG